MDCVCVLLISEPGNEVGFGGHFGSKKIASATAHIGDGHVLVLSRTKCVVLLWTDC